MIYRIINLESFFGGLRCQSPWGNHMWVQVIPLYQSRNSNVVCVMYWGLCKMLFGGKVFFLDQGKKKNWKPNLLEELETGSQVS